MGWIYKHIDIERSIHSLKTGLACLIGFMLIKSLHWGVDQWLIVTIIVVMTAQISVGSMIQKSYLRLLGTLIGSSIALATLYFFGHDLIATATIIASTVIIFSYLATGPNELRELGTLGAVTVVIILIGQHPTPLTALERCIDISAGILVAALVSQFILPIHARTHLRRNQSETLQQLQKYYQIAMIEQEDMHQTRYQDIEANIVKSIATQRTLAISAKREPLGEKFNSEHFKKFLQCEVAILRSIDFMHYAIVRKHSTQTILSNLPHFQRFHAEVCQSLQQIQNLINQPAEKNQTVKIPSIAELKTELQQLPFALSEEETTNMHTFFFCAEILVEQLRKLFLLYKVEDLATEKHA